MSMKTADDAGRRYAQIEGERDYHRCRAEMLERQRDDLRDDLQSIVDCWDGPLYKHEMMPLIVMARATLRRCQ